MAVVVKEDSKPFTCVDEDDALLNEAISCSRNLEIKTDDDDDDDEEGELKNISNNEKMNKEVERLKPSPILWCDMESDSSNSRIDLSNTSGKSDLSLSAKTDISTSDVKNESEENGKMGKSNSQREFKIEIMDSVKNKKEIQTEVKKESDKSAMDTSDDSENVTPCKRIKQEEPVEEPKDRSRRNSDTSSSTLSNQSNRKNIEYETDAGVLARRQKDIDYGKNTIGYDVYTQQVPKDQRSKEHPRTPPMYLKYSRRGWDGMVKLWRKQLHMWDPENGKGDKKDDVES